jgi:hypothetical protein
VQESLKHKIPLILLYSRLVFVFAVIALTPVQDEWIRYVVIAPMYIGLLIPKAYM